MIGRSLGISGSRSAQGAAACRLGSKGLRSSAFRSYVRSGDAQTQGTQGFEPPGDSYVALEVGVLQGGWVMQQQEQEKEHASSSTTSSSSRRRARDPQLRARGVCVPGPGACACAWGDRSLSPAQQPLRMPLGSRSNQLSNVLDLARLSQRA